MIISHGRRYIFVHIPKTGGTSLALALEDRAMKDDIMLGDTPKAKKRRRRLKDAQASGRLWKHSRIRDIYGLVTQEEVEAFFVFTLVRNPWDRMVSYYHWLRVQQFDHPAVTTAKSLGFSEFLHGPAIARSVKTSDYASYTRDAQGRDVVNSVLRLEHLEQDIGALETHLGFSLGDIPHVNTSARANSYQSYYSDRDVDHVAQLCATDISRFDYRFDGS